MDVHLLTARGSEQFCPYNGCYLSSEPNAILFLNRISSSLLPSSTPIPLALLSSPPMEHSVFHSASLRTPAVNSTFRASLPHRTLLIKPAATVPSTLIPNFAVHLQPRWPCGCRRSVSTKSGRRTSIQVCLVP